MRLGYFTMGLHPQVIFKNHQGETDTAVTVERSLDELAICEEVMPRVNAALTGEPARV